MQNPIQYMRQMVLAYVFVEGWIIYPYEQCFFCPSAEVLVFPPHNAEIFYGNIMTSDAKVVIDGGRCLEMFFEPLTKCYRGFTNVFLITLNPLSLVSVYDSTFFWMVSWSFGAIRRFFIVFPLLK